MNKYNFLSLMALLVVVVAIPLYAKQEQARLSNAQDGLQEKYIQDGSVLYLQFCADCHGSNGEGIGINPALNRLGISEADPNMLFKVISRATHGSSMAAWHLDEGGIFNDYQVTELVTLIRFADWSRVDRMASEKGLVFTNLSTRNLVDVSTSILQEQDPHLCISCHEEPEIHEESFGLDCVRCHSLTAWTPAVLTRHTFRLNHGSKENIACQTCHIEKYSENTCYECHDHDPNQMIDVHEAEGIVEFDQCISCHPTGDAGEAELIWQEAAGQEG
jgi:mono/diheme cytochrome c family protein